MSKPRLTPTEIATLMLWCGHADEGASVANLASRAAKLTGRGVTPVRLDIAGQIERPPSYSTAWSTPARTLNAIAAVFKEEPDANAFAVGGLVFRPGNHFASRLMFAPKATRKPLIPPQAARNDNEQFRKNVDRVVRAGLSHKPETRR